MKRSGYGKDQQKFSDKPNMVVSVSEVVAFSEKGLL